MDLKKCKLLGVFSQMSHFQYISALKLLFPTTSGLRRSFSVTSGLSSGHFRSASTDLRPPSNFGLISYPRKMVPSRVTRP